MNKVFLIGNLTRDPELTETSGGTKICRFGIAINRYNRGEQKTDFYNCVAWTNLAETVANYAKKGTKVAVSGSIELRDYEDSQGIKRTGIDIIVRDFELLSPRSNGNSDDYEGSAPAQRGGSKPQLQPFDDDTDIPF